VGGSIGAQLSDQGEEGSLCLTFQTDFIPESALLNINTAGNTLCVCVCVCVCEIVNIKPQNFKMKASRLMTIQVQFGRFSSFKVSMIVLSGAYVWLSVAGLGSMFVFKLARTAALSVTSHFLGSRLQKIKELLAQCLEHFRSV